MILSIPGAQGTEALDGPCIPLVSSFSVLEQYRGGQVTWLGAEQVCLGGDSCEARPARMSGTEQTGALWGTWCHAF